MLHRIIILFAIMLSVGIIPVKTYAEVTNLNDAWNITNASSPVLSAAQAQLKATQESISEATGGWQPKVDATGTIGRTWAKLPRASSASGKDTASATSRDVGLSVDQPIFNGFGTVAATAKAKAVVRAAEARLLDTEQNLMLDVGTTYVDLVYAQAVNSLKTNNESVLQQQLAATRDRYEAGTMTRTDVSQSESRWQRARADLVQAQGALALQRATFTRLVGQSPGIVEAPNIELDPALGDENIISLAEEENPLVIAATADQEAAKENIRIARSPLLPEVSVSASANFGVDSNLGGAKGDSESQSIQAKLRVPLYAGGADWARLRAARQSETAAKINISEIRRRAREQAVSAWQALLTARGATMAEKAYVEAAELALAGVKEELNVGTRTTLDVLDAEQELLDARVALLGTQRDEAKAILAVRAAIGKLTVQALGLSGGAEQ